MRLQKHGENCVLEVPNRKKELHSKMHDLILAPFFDPGFLQFDLFWGFR